MLHPKQELKKGIRLILCLLLGMTASTALAQEVSTSFSRQLRQLKQHYMSLADSSAHVDEINPLYYRLLGPATFYSNALEQAFTLKDSAGVADAESLLKRAIDEELVKVYISHPRAIHRSDAQFADIQLLEEKKPEKNVSAEINTVLADGLKGRDIAEAAADIDDIGLQIKRPNFWKKTGSFSMQFTQNYFSENWYRGGSNTQNMLASLTLQANYNDQQHITWENRLTMRLGFITSPSDSVHTFLTNNDKLNLYSKLGVKAAKNWYYTVTAEANTQFMPSYRANNRLTYADFLSPLDFYVSIGMDYKPKLKNNNTFSVALLPLSYKFRYINADDKNIHRVLGMNDESFRQDWGSKIEVNAQFSLVKNLTWKCRAYYFTSYEYAEAELENSLSFSFNRYLSTELYTLWRFDDNRPHQYYDDNLGYFQFKEYFTFGLKYDF